MRSATALLVRSRVVRACGGRGRAWLGTRANIPSAPTLASILEHGMEEVDQADPPRHQGTGASRPTDEASDPHRDDLEGTGDTEEYRVMVTQQAAIPVGVVESALTPMYLSFLCNMLQVDIAVHDGVVVVTGTEDKVDAGRRYLEDNFQDYREVEVMPAVAETYRTDEDLLLRTQREFMVLMVVDFARPVVTLLGPPHMTSKAESHLRAQGQEAVDFSELLCEFDGAHEVGEVEEERKRSAEAARCKVRLLGQSIRHATAVLCALKASLAECSKDIEQLKAASPAEASALDEAVASVNLVCSQSPALHRVAAPLVRSGDDPLDATARRIEGMDRRVVWRMLQQTYESDDLPPELDPEHDVLLFEKLMPDVVSPMLRNALHLALDWRMVVDRLCAMPTPQTVRVMDTSHLLVFPLPSPGTSRCGTLIPFTSLWELYGLQRSDTISGRAADRLRTVVQEALYSFGDIAVVGPAAELHLAWQHRRAAAGRVSDISISKPDDRILLVGAAVAQFASSQRSSQLTTEIFTEDAELSTRAAALGVRASRPAYLRTAAGDSAQ
eukprot:Sspe_Gene.85333::Locus_56111_Transcript_1_1_Confidence_1.000_Length_1791::g.85333::m.85333